MKKFAQIITAVLTFAGIVWYAVGPEEMSQRMHVLFFGEPPAPTPKTIVITEPAPPPPAPSGPMPSDIITPYLPIIFNVEYAEADAVRLKTDIVTLRSDFVSASSTLPNEYRVLGARLFDSLFAGITTAESAARQRGFVWPTTARKSSGLTDTVRLLSQLSSMENRVLSDLASFRQMEMRIARERLPRLRQPAINLSSAPSSESEDTISPWMRNTKASPNHPFPY